MALGSIPSTLATVGVLYALHLHGDAASKFISTVLGFALLLTAATLLFRRQIFAFAERRAGVLGPRATAILTVALGAVLGVLITPVIRRGGSDRGERADLPLSQAADGKIVGSDIAHAVR